MEKVAVGPPGFQRCLHGRRRDGEIEKADRGLVGLKFSLHEPRSSGVIDLRQDKKTIITRRFLWPAESLRQIKAVPILRPKLPQHSPSGAAVVIPAFARGSEQPLLRASLLPAATNISVEQIRRSRIIIQGAQKW
jgi:hypothetical protein